MDGLTVPMETVIGNLLTCIIPIAGGSQVRNAHNLICFNPKPMSINIVVVFLTPTQTDSLLMNECFSLEGFLSEVKDTFVNNPVHHG